MGDSTLLQARIIVPNTIVEFLQDNLIQIGLVLEEQKGKLRLLLPNRREINLSENRVLPWIGPNCAGLKSKEEMVNTLIQHKDKRKDIKDALNILEIWEMVQGEVYSESVKFFAELINSNPDYDTLAGFAHALLDQKSHFKFINPQFEIFPEDLVKEKLENQRVNQEREKLVGTGANWFNYLWELHLKDQNFLEQSQRQSEPEEAITQRLKELLMARIVDAQSSQTSHDDDFWKQIVKQLPDDNNLPLLLATAWGLVPKHYNFWLAAAEYNPSEDFASAHQDYIKSCENFVHSLQEINPEQVSANLRTYSNLNNLTKPEKPNPNSMLGLQLSQKLAKLSSNSLEQEVQEKSSTKLKTPLSKADDLEQGKSYFNEFLNKDFISIDSKSTTDIDDAFTISINQDGNFDVYIALACPACLWEFNSPFDKLIMHRSTSLYLPEATYHMMPKELSTELFSLKEEEVKPCLLCHSIVSPTGELLSASWDFMRAKIQDNLHYFSCEAVLNGQQGQEEPEQRDEIDFLDYLENMDNLAENSKPLPLDLNNFEKAKKYAEVLNIAHQFAKMRLAWRITQGAVIIEKPDLSISLAQVESQEVLVEVEQCPNAPKSQLIISELMVLANAALAEFGIKYNFPLIFRSQDIALPKEFSGVWTRPQDIAKVARCLSGASTETVPKPHTGLGLKAYSPVTSPLRRYVDLVNSAQLIYFLQNSKPLWNKQELDKLLFSIHLYNDKVNLVQKFRPRYWLFVYLQQEAKRQGEKCGFKAIISDENDQFITATLSKELLPIRAKRHVFGEKALLGQEVMLRLGKINPLRQEVSIMSVEFLG